ncbi:Uncharacterized protein FWK35_00010802 [Aphis craccivora]|uniref:Uncharacterized protein n=1 Tax=Aphis craccivora TaxID=307492 RepID=A0A6G0ZDL0_APHCR|nr:Uncharacterized protein FWK35_00010802 [Aphis craccivora]
MGLMSSNLPNDETKEFITEEDSEKITNEPINHRRRQNEFIEIAEKNSELGEKMMKFSKEKFPQLEIGTTVRVTTPDVDRARGSPRNILAVVTQVVHDLYKLCKYGKWFSLTQLHMPRNSYLQRKSIRHEQCDKISR